MKILISGSHGMIGSHLVRVLSSRGHAMTPLVRRLASDRSQKVSWLPKDGFIESQKMEGFHAVIHLAGANVAEGRWTEERKASIRDSRVLGTSLLARTITRLPRPPRVLLCASAVGIYGDRGDEWVDETSPAGDGFLAGVCREWEAAAQPAIDAGIRTVFLRLGIVLSTTGGALQKLLPIFRLGLGGPVGPGTQYMSWVGLPDVSHAMLRALDDPSFSGPVNVVAPQPVTSKEFARTLGRTLRRPALLPAPVAALNLLYGQEMTRECFLASTRVRPARLMEAGFDFRFNRLEDAFASILRYRL